jgi:RNA polymerase sigma-70 factor, ECF subfamily
MGNGDGRGGDDDDAILVDRFRRGDESAFRAIAERHGPWLQGLLGSIIPGGGEEASDALQEILIALASGGLRRFRGDCGLRTLLYRMALNKAADAVRRKRAERRKLERAAKLMEPMLDAGAEAALLEAEEAKAVRLALGRLRPADRALLHLREFEGASLAEIAAALGIGEGAAKLRLHRARRRFAALWSEETEG